jgi:hypothetical protein
MLDKFDIGDLDPASINVDEVMEDRVCEKTGRKVALHPKHTRAYTLQEETRFGAD